MKSRSKSKNLGIKIPIALAIAALVAGCGGGDGSPSDAQHSLVATQKDAVSDAIAGMRAQWQTYVTGGAVDTSDPDVSAKISSIVSTAQQLQNDFVSAANRTTCLWTGNTAANTATHPCDWTQSSSVRNNFLNVQSMVLAYTTQGSSLHGNQALRAQIVDALQWLYTNHYSPSISQFDNWWDWEIGIPKTLGSILIPLYSDLTNDSDPNISGLIGNYVTAMDHFNADPTNQTWPVTNPPVAMTGANLLDKVVGRIFSGMLANDGNKITAARNAMAPVYNNVTSDDGFYADGSFIQHHYVSYIGGYGASVIDDMTNLMYLTNNTQWSFSSAEIQSVAGWVDNSIAPFIYGGAMMDMTRGRQISRSATSDHMAGRAMSVSVRRLADAADAATAAHINSLVKGWIQSDTTFNSASGCTSACYMWGVSSLYDMVRVKALLADSTVTGSTVQTSRVFGSMARAVHTTPTFGFGLSMFSDRISSFEYGNGENKKGWLTGAGMSTMYTDDEKQFTGNFWATVDSGRLPGTTVDGSNFNNPNTHLPVDWSFYGNALNNLRWTGGSSVAGTYSSAGMEFDMSGFLSQEPPQGRTSPSGLTGRKSWFMMDDRIVALGSDIADNAASPVETIVDNRKLVPPYSGSAGGANKLTINNSGYNNASLGAGTQTVANVKWAHIQGSSQSTCSPVLNDPCPTGSKGIGYFFPTPVTLSVLREARTGAWSDVNAGGSATQVTDNYLSLAIPEGTAPASASYAYVLLPNKSAAEVNAIASNSGISILSNGNGIHAVMYTPSAGNYTRVVGANFWNASGGTVNVSGQSYLTSSSKASVTVAETASQLSVAVSDPTEANNGVVTVTINHNASSVAGTPDSAITVVSLSPIQLSVNVNAAHGRSIAANFNF
ncbi:hypothetical protein C7H84_21890 [Burkholderia sp. Nafp2/4-1b]|uniref:polysaccharide lyase 8 family protein n=1 Tax=Burkholderia sp. Nafp2/4-1b TaxID=2116686 RepID=UPI000EF92E79|nr:polysaccharide lyase 8 family protein [Burkholderia sp. Nafp2/4-1b]RKU01299.1 hypothetical protein C7H84_21890 [Burkholderia sp. Nafp2/4-1b]